MVQFGIAPPVSMEIRSHKFRQIKLCFPSYRQHTDVGVFHSDRGIAWLILNGIKPGVLSVLDVTLHRAGESDLVFPSIGPPRWFSPPQMIQIIAILYPRNAQNIADRKRCFTLMVTFREHVVERLGIAPDNGHSETGVYPFL